MTHDPLCLGSRLPEDMNWPARCACDLIAKVREDAIAAAVQRVEELTIPHHFPVDVTCDVWNQVIGECIAAIKGDSDA